MAQDNQKSFSDQIAEWAGQGNQTQVQPSPVQTPQAQQAQQAQQDGSLSFADQIKEWATQQDQQNPLLPSPEAPLPPFPQSPFLPQTVGAAMFNPVVNEPHVQFLRKNLGLAGEYTGQQIADALAAGYDVMRGASVRDYRPISEIAQKIALTMLSPQAHLFDMIAPSAPGESLVDRQNRALETLNQAIAQRHADMGDTYWVGSQLENARINQEIQDNPSLAAKLVRAPVEVLPYILSGIVSGGSVPAMVAINSALELGRPENIPMAAALSALPVVPIVSRATRASLNAIGKVLGRGAEQVIEADITSGARGAAIQATQAAAPVAAESLATGATGATEGFQTDLQSAFAKLRTADPQEIGDMIASANRRFDRSEWNPELGMNVSRTPEMMNQSEADFAAIKSLTPEEEAALGQYLPAREYEPVAWNSVRDSIESIPSAVPNAQLDANLRELAAFFDHPTDITPEMQAMGGGNPRPPSSIEPIPTTPSALTPASTAITSDMRQQLSDLGYTKAEVENMIPSVARAILREQGTPAGAISASISGPRINEPQMAIRPTSGWAKALPAVETPAYINRQMYDNLRSLGYTDQEITNMAPAEGQRIIQGRVQKVTSGEPPQPSTGGGGGARGGGGGAGRTPPPQPPSGRGGGPTPGIKYQPPPGNLPGGTRYDNVINNVFHDFTNSKLGRAIQELNAAYHAPKAMMAAGDLSAFRQGALLTLPPSRWKMAAEGTLKMFEAIPEKGFNRIVDEFVADSDSQIAQEHGLNMTSVAKRVTGRGFGEEPFISATEKTFIGKIVGRMPQVKASDQAYAVYLDYIRLNSFKGLKNLIDKYFDNIDPTKLGFQTLEEANAWISKTRSDAYRSAAKWINIATGRGSFGEKFERAMPLLNSLGFAPRYVMSRFNLLDPRTYLRNAFTPWGRIILKQQMSDTMQAAGVVATIALLAVGAGASVSLHPQSTDFLKIKFGNYRYDFGAGVIQTMRLIFGTATAAAKAAEGQKLQRGQTVVDIGEHFLRSKLAPVPAFFYDMFAQKTYTGEKFSLKKETLDLVVPLAWQDWYDAYTKAGLEGAAKVSPGFFGIGTQFYQTRLNDTLLDRAYPLWSEFARLNRQVPAFNQNKGEPDQFYQDRLKASGEALQTYGNQLIESPFYKQATDQQKAAALQTLTTRITEVATRKQPVQVLRPIAIMSQVQTSTQNKQYQQLYRQRLYQQGVAPIQ